MASRFAVLLFVVLSACATPYQENGFQGGVRAAPLGGDNYRVEANLNGYSSASMAQDYLLLKAAETALQNGAVGFVIQGAQDTTKSSTYVTPGQSYTTASAYGTGNSVYGQSTTTYSAPQIQHVEKPGGMLLITLVRDPVPSGLSFFNASEIVAAIGPRVKRGG
ncbi:MAG: hypothetical protein QM773_05560 [Hyphomonadaceae bacterium]